MDRIERLTQRQIWLCLINVCAYTAWQGAQLSVFEGSPLALGVAVVGWAIWFATLLVILWPFRKIRTRAAFRDLMRGGDERMARNSLRAVAASFWCMVFVVAASFPMAMIFQIGAMDLLRVFVIAIVAAPITFFALLEARDGREG